MPLVVVRYSEILLKRGNRQRFAAQLLRNLRRAGRGLPLGRAADHNGRIVVELEDASAWPEARARLGRVFGVANFSLASELVRTEPQEDLRRLCEAVGRELCGRSFGSFRVATRRADKGFPLPSPEVNARLGAYLKERTGTRVDLERADLTVTVEILPGRILWSVEKVDGAGGLPVGSSGHVLVLLSGGIDSPVAALRMMRRGCRASFVHFHAVPYLDRSSQEKCRELLRRLVQWEYDARLVLVPLGEVQRRIVQEVPPPPRVVLYRRMMMRIASEVARRLGASALVTGESLGQVASQTLPNLAAIEEAAGLPVLRPLVGMGKEEITADARRFGTFDISVEPDQDCCSLFVPRHPDTSARLEAIRRYEARLDLDGLVRAALEGVEVERWFYPDTSRDPKRESLGTKRPDDGAQSASDAEGQAR
jgi:thiamine biosynthesis protein ThiI